MAAAATTSEAVPEPLSNKTAPSTANVDETRKAQQPALATSKRKFHQLLESLTSAPKARKSTKENGPTREYYSSAKRVRLEARARLDAGSQSTRGRVEAQLLRIKLEAARTSPLLHLTDESNGQGSKLAPYNPWSHVGFLKRLETFANVRHWSAKPDDVNEVAWAKRGWSCIGVNEVACHGGCEARFTVSLRPPLQDANGNNIPDSEDLGAEVSPELVSRIAAQIGEAHNESCLWRRSGCSDEIYRLQLVRQTDWLPGLQKRYHSLKNLGIVVTGEMDVVATSKRLPPAFWVGGVDEIIDMGALGASLAGWESWAEATTSHPVAKCGACFRRVGLWLTQNHFDAVKEHRSYCPWVSGTSQAMPVTGTLKDLDGIQVLAKVIASAARFRGAPAGTVSTSDGTVVASLSGESSVTPKGGGSKTTNDDSAPPAQAPSTSMEQVITKNGPYAADDYERLGKLAKLSRTVGLKSLGRRLARAGF